VIADNDETRKVYVMKTGSFVDESFFDLVLIKDGQLYSGDPVMLQTYDGHLLGAEGGGGSSINSNAVTRGQWETFVIEKDGGGLIATGDAVGFKATDGLHYMSASIGGDNALQAQSTAFDINETFILHDPQSNSPRPIETFPAETTDERDTRAGSVGSTARITSDGVLEVNVSTGLMSGTFFGCMVLIMDDNNIIIHHELIGPFDLQQREQRNPKTIFLQVTADVVKKARSIRVASKNMDKNQWAEIAREVGGSSNLVLEKIHHFRKR
jgi:hypothetical protein